MENVQDATAVGVAKLKNLTKTLYLLSLNQST